ncbi:retinol-binding protein 1-like protein [Lates japonicus]|uniref:Cellular retinoic acid-binding protein 1 n=1 Tax=Lates japonicus TaxID=270547 RepID=A0AAD3MPS1_LATJO|nr:retinol-binding protein 1-like protein [Lates japonicus]
MSKPNYSGTYHMVEQDNMDSYLAALDINFALRKIVCLLKPTKEITHDPATGAMKIRTLTTFKNFNMDFTIGKEFTEDLGPVDGRSCQTTVSWEGDKLVCVQRGEKEGRGWTHWLEGDKLHLVRMEGKEEDMFYYEGFAGAFLKEKKMTPQRRANTKDS